MCLVVPALASLINESVEEFEGEKHLLISIATMTKPSVGLEMPLN